MENDKVIANERPSSPLSAHIDLEDWRADWAEYTGADAGFHYCSKCRAQAFNYDEASEVVEVLSDFCPSCGRAMNKNALAVVGKRFGGQK